MPQLEINDLSIEYRRSDGRSVQAVADVSLAVEEGEFIGIVGPSGCGKTTMLKAVSGLLSPTAGAIFLNGGELRQTSSDRATVFQEASLFPWYTINRNVAYGLECRGMSKKEAAQRVRPFISLVGLDGFGDHYPYEVSGGMQQRANLARALAVEPKILLMDEPFAALDAQTREHMQSELMDICGQTGKTVLFITHQIDEAIYLSDRVVVLSARPGRVVEDIPIDFARPRRLRIKRDPAFARYEETIWSLIERQTSTRSAARLDETGNP